MATEQSAPADSASIEDRLAAIFSNEPEAANADPQATEPAEALTEDATEEEPAASDDDGEEFEVEGTTYRLPPQLKQKVQEWRDGSMREADYTRKTTELAALTKHIATVAEVAQARQQFEATIADERGELAQVQSQLNAFKQVDWNSVDADTAQRLFFQREQLKEKAKEIEGKLSVKGEQFRQWSDGKRREVLAQGQRYLTESIKGWGKEAQTEVVNAARELGYTGHEIESVMDPRMVRALYESAQYRKLLSGKAEAVKTAKAPPVIKPGAVNPMPGEVKQKLAYRKELSQAKGSHKKADIIAKRLESMFK